MGWIPHVAMTRPRISHRHRCTSTDPPAGSSRSPPAVIGVTAPLKNLGPYPVLGLKLPDLPHAPSLDFILDTGANTNTISSQLVESLNLPVALPGSDLLAAAGMGGTMNPSDTYMLGPCQLTGLPGPSLMFMNNLTAAALPSPHQADGLLALPFFQSIPAGVELDWYGTDGDPPTITFYYGTATPPEALKNMIRVKLDQLQPVGLLTVRLQVNDTWIRAILDTGSPITILTPKAAKKAGIATVDEQKWRPLPKPKIGDDSIRVGGVDGGQASLQRSKSTTVPVKAGEASLGEGPVYVGELPGMTLIGELVGRESEPSAILGLDFMRRAYRMIVKIASAEDELWIEELADQPKWDGQTDYKYGPPP